MEQSTAPTAVVAQPKTIVIERRRAIIGGAVIAALIIGLGIALAFAASDDGPGGPAGFQLSSQGAQGYGLGPAPPGTQPMPEGGVPVPQAPDGSYPPQGTYPPSGSGVPVPPRSQGGNGGSGGSNN